MELEGNLILERRPARRWVSVIAVIVPVVACLAGVTWFVRAFISPPTIAIPSPMSLAAAPPAPPAQAEPPVAPQPVASATAASPAPTHSPPASSDTAPVALPMFATLAAAPPTFSSAPPGGQFTGTPAAYADPAREPAASNFPAAADAMVDAPPLAGPVPMPRPRPQATAALADTVPLPRARPGEEASAQAPGTASASQPDFGRHGAE
jgi:hypothetical protein